MTYRKGELLPIEQVSTDAVKPQIGWVEISELRIDAHYQRDIERRGLQNIEAIASDFRWSRFTPVLCAPMDDGNFAIIDGQHRTHAALACGFTKVPALIVPMTDREQAEAFSWVNGAVTAITPLQLYKAALAGGQDWALACQKAVEDAGCKLMTTNKSSSEKKAGQVFCVKTVKGYVTQGKAGTLTKVLKAVQRCQFLADPYFYGAGILGALVEMVIDHKHLQTGRIVEFLEQNDITDIERAVHRLREQPAYFRQPHRKLLIAVLRAKWRDFNAAVPQLAAAAPQGETTGVAR